MSHTWLIRILIFCSVCMDAVAQSDSLVFNELLARNRTGILDETGDASDWIEIYNPGSTPVSLSGYALSDSTHDPRRWVFQSGTLASHGFLLVFADGKDRQLRADPPRKPQSIPGLSYWFNGSLVDPSNTNQVRKSGTSTFIRRWENQAFPGHDFSQSSGGLQPTWFAASNGLPAFVRFDGINDTLNLLEIPATNSFCIVAVVRNRALHEIDGASGSGTGGTAGQHYFLGANHMGALDGGMGVSMGMNGASCYEHGDGYMPAVAVTAAPLTNQFQVVAFQYSNKTARIEWQGNLAAEGQQSSRRSVTAPTSLGSGTYGSWSGDVAELLIFNRTLSNDDLKGIQRHLMNSYRLPTRDGIHANFSLSSKGETLYLRSPEGRLLDTTTIPADLPADVSVGRFPDAQGPWVYFANPTPGASNNTAPAFQILPEPSFSKTPGYYKEAFPLLLSNQVAQSEIHYTLDGSEPTLKSPRYTNALSMTNRARAPNNLSLIPTTPGAAPAPNGLVYKFAVVRARAFASNAIPSPIITGSFIVDSLGANRYTMPVVSLTTARANLFDDNIGIYVPGNAPGGNYAQSGDAWERPGWVEFFETDGTLAFSQGTGIRMHGNTSFLFPIKGLRLHPLNDPGTGPFQYRIFPDRPTQSFNRLLLRPSGHDYNLTLFRDVFMQSLGSELGLETQASRPAILFINGEYWGIHHCQEAFEPGYFSERSESSRQFGTDYLEGYAAAVDGDAAQWTEMMGFLQTHPLTTSSNYLELQRWMDPSNYANYKIAETYYYRWDIGNHRLWRPRTPDGRFRWILFDCDVGWGGFWSVAPAWSFPMLDYNLEDKGPWTQYESQPGGNDHNSPTTTYLLRTLMDQPEFRRSFITRFADVMNTTFQSNHVHSRIDEFASRLAPEIAEHVRRWQAPISVNEWSNQVRYLHQFAHLRPGFMYQQMASRLGLPGTLKVTLRANDSEAGTIQLNSISIRPALSDPWTGIYFQNHPITALAKPETGFRFVRWSELSSTNNPITLTSTQPFTLTAIFEPAPDDPLPDPQPHVLSSSPFILQEWPAGRPEGTFPNSTQLLLSSRQDPTLATEVAFDRPWMLPYNLESKSRALGLNENGIGFLNTSDPQTPEQGFLGALVVAVDTRALQQTQVRFSASTLQPNNRRYGLRLQARVGDRDAFADVSGIDGNPVEYLSSQTKQERITLGPITLGPHYNNQRNVQLRWVYHFINGLSGPRPMIGLDDIMIAETIPNPAPQWRRTTLGPDLLLLIEAQCAPIMACVVESSSDFVQWAPRGSVTTDVEGRLKFQVRLETNPGKLFFRIRIP